MLAKDFLLFRTSFAVQPFFEGLAQGLPAIGRQPPTYDFQFQDACDLPSARHLL
jgi:hypothetical protein